MKAPNKYISIIFILAITYAIFNLVVPSSKKTWDARPDNATESPPGALELGGVFQEKYGPERNPDKKYERKMLPWGKDPFVFPEKRDPYKNGSNRKVVQGPVKKTKKVIKGKERPISVKITSVLISEDQKVATIDRAPYILTVGDWIGNDQVLEILPDRVIFGKNGRKKEILLKSKPKSSKSHRGKNES